jgi:hypothetical protein
MIRLVRPVTRPPTDFELLRAIYERHRDEYATFVKGAEGSRASKIAVPIDIPAIADELEVDVDSVFGRLYYHLDPLYEQRNEDGSRKAFFMPWAGPNRNCINFPLLEAVLAGLWQQRRRDLWTLWIAVGSLGIAIGSLAVALYAAA